MKFSASSVLFPELSERREIVSRVAKAGFDGIEWRVQTDYHIPPEELERQAAEIRALCDDAGLKIVNLATYLKWDEHKLIESVLRGAEIMGCPRIRLAGFNYDGSEDYHVVYDRAVKQMEALVPLVKSAGIKGTIENHFGTIHASAHGVYNLLRHFDHSHIACILDGSNLIVEGWENWQMVIELLDRYLDHVHVRNAAWYYTEGKGWSWKWVPLDKGIAHWPTILGILRKRGYGGFVSSENLLGVPTSSKGYIGEAHASLGGYDESRSIEERLSDLQFMKSAAGA
jgi:sugar phosphate isomerase/epimerase